MHGFPRCFVGRWSAPVLVLLFLLAARSSAANSELILSVGQLQHATSAGSTHSIPFFPAASDPLSRQGFARIVNRSGTSGTVTIDAFDDSGRNHGPVTLSLDARETAHFNSGDLEDGNAVKGLEQGTGRPTEGDWRLELTSDLDIMVLSYIRTTDGFVTAMHDVAPAESNSHTVVFFNPGSNAAQVSILRLVNAGNASASVTIHGVDDLGTRAGPVRLSIPARAAHTVSAAEMEDGAVGLTGSLGDGSGKWRLEVEADRPILVLSMLATPTGHLTNLSTAPEHVTVPSGMDQPPAPTVEVTGAREFQFSWMWSGEAGETHAFDHQARVGGGEWTDLCRDFTWERSGDGTITITVGTTRDIPAGTVVEARYRYRNASSCDAGSPGPWSRVGQATVGGDGGTGVDDHADTFADATAVSVPSTTAGELEEAGDRDYFRLVVDAATTLSVETTGGTDTYGTLFDGDGDSLEADDDSGAGTNFEIERAVEAGTYYVEVRGFRSSTTGSYALVVSEADDGGGRTDSYCRDDDDIAPGDRCDIYNTSFYFEVETSGSGCVRAGGFTSCAGTGISMRNATINGLRITFVAARNNDDSWTINDVEPEPAD